METTGIRAALNYGLAVSLFSMGLHWLLAGLVGGVAGAIWNFSTTNTFTWRKPKLVPTSSNPGSNGNDKKAHGP